MEEKFEINGENIELKLTPRALHYTEEKYSEFDILTMLREMQAGKEPKINDYYKVIYTGYIGGGNKEISFEDFLQLIEDNNIYVDKISRIGVDLINHRGKKVKSKFREGFKRVTKKSKSKIYQPNIHIETIEDMYVFYVYIYGIDEDTFWNNEIPFLDGIVNNISAYENYISSPKKRGS